MFKSKIKIIVLVFLIFIFPVLSIEQQAGEPIVVFDEPTCSRVESVTVQPQIKEKWGAYELLDCTRIEKGTWECGCKIEFFAKEGTINAYTISIIYQAEGRDEEAPLSRAIKEIEITGDFDKDNAKEMLSSNQTEYELLEIPPEEIDVKTSRNDTQQALNPDNVTEMDVFIDENNQTSYPDLTIEAVNISNMANLSLEGYRFQGATNDTINRTHDVEGSEKKEAKRSLNDIGMLALLVFGAYLFFKKEKPKEEEDNNNNNENI